MWEQLDRSQTMKDVETKGNLHAVWQTWTVMLLPSALRYQNVSRVEGFLSACVGSSPFTPAPADDVSWWEAAFPTLRQSLLTQGEL